MKKSRINLLTSKEDYYRLEKYFTLFQRFVLGYSILFTIGIGILIYNNLQQNFKLESLTRQKQSLLSRLSKHRNDETKLIILSKKMGYYNEFIRDDARFIPYYNLLLETLKNSSQSAALTEFDIDKSRQVNFTLTFDNFDEMVQSFQFIESEQFIHNFEHLDMTDFIGSQSESIKYQLSFIGKFRTLNETEN